MSSKEDKMDTAEHQQTVDKEMEAEKTAADSSENENSLDELIEEQQKRINELEEELQQTKDHHLRKMAEMENFKKRLQRERDLVFQKSKETAVDAFLPVYDDLQRTLEALQQSKVDPSFIDGVKLVSDKFQDVLNRYDVERIDETGVPFDVDLHDAMMRKQADDDSIESGTVLQVLESGYKMGDKTLRHAKVIVSE
ncbi:nucleotide exchange factor GrpE [Rhodohalobacter halophilus]|uniref:nucleotide exchange factor GrpE n=1 Tax=Rhodohalobacter halophilus TaxID=1812810 RepID=UPI00083F5910|nr:nucleotide exchange factor GrpE [Rhodohalobacter halophilus]